MSLLAILTKTQKPIRNEPQKEFGIGNNLANLLVKFLQRKESYLVLVQKEGNSKSVCALNALRQLFKEKVMKNMLRSADWIPLVLNAINLGGTFHLKASLVR